MATKTAHENKNIMEIVEFSVDDFLGTTEDQDYYDSDDEIFAHNKVIVSSYYDPKWRDSLEVMKSRAIQRHLVEELKCEYDYDEDEYDNNFIQQWQESIGNETPAAVTKPCMDIDDEDEDPIRFGEDWKTSIEPLSFTEIVETKPKKLTKIKPKEIAKLVIQRLSNSSKTSGPLSFRFINQIRNRLKKKSK